MHAGGGLGKPPEAYFVWGERTPGRLDFAYTKRFYGPGATGTVPLLSVRVSTRAGFSLGDFTLDTAAGTLLARDSAKREFGVTLAGEVR